MVIIAALVGMALGFAVLRLYLQVFDLAIVPGDYTDYSIAAAIIYQLKTAGMEVRDIRHQPNLQVVISRLSDRGRASIYSILDELENDK